MATDGAYRVLFLTDTTPKAYLLRGGTQVGELPASSTDFLQEEIRSGGLKRGDDSRLWRNFWNPSDPLQPFMWGTGLEMTWSMSVSGTKNASPQFVRQMDLVFAQRPLPWILTELGGHLSAYGGGLLQQLYQEVPPEHDYWSHAWPWWHAALGIPGIKWEVALANRPLPELYWLEPHAGWASYLAGRSRAGDTASLEDAEALPGAKFLRRWTRTGDPIPSGRNLSHTLHAKAGPLLYSAYIDPDLYRSVVHRVFFGGLPGPRGTWGFGFFLADGIGQSLFRYDLAPGKVRVGDPADGNVLHLSLLRLELAYRDNMRYRVALATGIHLDSRTFTHGSKP